LNPGFDPAKPPPCDLCKAAPAAIQLVEQKGGETRRVSLCAACASKQGISHDGANVTFNLPAILAAMTGAAQTTPPVACPSCGMTAADFQRLGRLGCSRCYEVFAAQLEPVIKRFQAGAAHRGLAPTRLGAVAELSELAALRVRLQECVRSESYEEAARLRDRIRELEKRA